MGNLVSFCGIFILVFVAWLFSEDRKRFPWRVVTWGIGLQLIFGFLVLYWPPGSRFFLRLNDVFNALLAFSREGAVFIFNSVGSGESTGQIPLTLKEYLTRLGAGSSDPLIQRAIATGTVPGFFFAFQALTTIIFFSALLSVLYYLGIMQKVVQLFAKIMSKTMRVSGAEALSNSANIFVGQTEAPLVVRPYIEKMTRSELMAIMVGGFANTAGGVLGAYIMMLSGYFPNIASHLISASLLSAPAAFIFAKVLVPEREQPMTSGDVKFDVPIEDANLVDAAANGTSIGWQLAINVGAMLVSFVALIALANVIVAWIGNLFHSDAGLVRFDLIAIGGLAALFLLRRRTNPTEGQSWIQLLGVFALYGAAKFVIPAYAGTIGLAAFAAWLPLFFYSGSAKKPPTAVWGTVLGVAVIGNLAYLIFGPLGADTKMSLQLLLGWMHWPIALIMGVPPSECLTVAKFLGEKLILTEFVAYLDLANYLGQAARGEVQELSARSLVLLTYALCGFSNFASIGIQIGGIAPLAPGRRQELARLGLKAMIGGALATFMIACIAGTFFTGHSMLGLK
ncbi:MAG: nucleoside transporter C-terminal domain-containing protein [Thermoanaerobaculia bacterium]